jgi:ABC-type amino acid transport substrate-binding protein
MRFVRPFFALAALCAATACASSITAPEAPSRNAEGGGLMGSGTVVATSGGTWIGTGNAAPAPGDTTGRGGTWIGTGN